VGCRGVGMWGIVSVWMVVEVLEEERLNAFMITTQNIEGF